jgi:hypothetical protein
MVRSRDKVASGADQEAGTTGIQFVRIMMEPLVGEVMCAVHNEIEE